MKMLRILAFTAMLTMFAAVAHADTLTWTLSGVTFSDGGTASGSFNYNTSTNTITSFNISTTAGSTFSAFNYNSSANSANYVVGDSLLFAHGGTVVDRYLRLFLLPGVASLNTPGTITFGGGDPAEGYECLNCSPVRDITGGSLTSVSDTPEPGSLALLGSGLIGLAGGIRRKLIA